MNPRNNGTRRPSSYQQTPERVPALPLPKTQEPSMRRWQHPVAAQPPQETLSAELHELRCALSRQTRLLSEIRELLERLTRSLPDHRDSAP